MKCPHCDGTGEISVPNGSPHSGLLILAARKAAGMTQSDLGTKVGRSNSHIANIEKGRFSFDVRQLAAFAEALGVTAKDLVP